MKCLKVFAFGGDTETSVVPSMPLRRRGRHNNAATDPSPSHGSSDAGSHPALPQTPSSSFFNRASRAHFRGGEFTGQQNIGVLQVFHNPSQHRSAFNGIGSSEARPPDPPPAPPAQSNQGTPFGIGLQRTVPPAPSRSNGLNLGRLFRRRASPSQILHENNVPVERDVFKIYKGHLLPKGYGHPLWIPQSNMRLPIPYRQIGISIGDVGIITPEGAFDFLFNICYPRGHPINSRVPSDFEPISLESNVLEFRDFSAGAFLTSDDIQADPGHPNGVNFTTSSPQGAILTTPTGAYFQRLANANHFHEYIAANAASWYRFVNGEMRRGAGNGDIRLVLGCHKSTTWGMATVMNNSQYIQSQTLRFRAFQPQTDSPHYSYFWEASGSALVKVGPELGDNDGLVENQPYGLRNQCLFVRANAITLGKDSWSQLNAGNVASRVDVKENHEDNDVASQTVPNGLHDHNTIPRDIENAYQQVALQSDTQTLVDVTIFSSLPESSDAQDTIDHTKAINALLLQKNPEMQVAIVQDNDWCSVLNGEDPSKVTSSELFSRIWTKNDIRKTSAGLVYFELKDQNPEKPPTRYTEHEAIDLLRLIQRNHATLRAKLLTNLPDLKQLDQIIRLGYFSYLDHVTTPDQFPPFLMERPEDLFVFDKLLEFFQSDDPSLSPIHLDHNLTKSQAYKELNSPSFPQAHRRRYLKALGDHAWKRYLQFERLDDLDETIWLYEKTISLTPSFTIQSLVPLFGLCSALFRRFVLKRNLRDLVHLARYVRRQESINLDDLIGLLPTVSTTPVSGDKEDDLTIQTMPFLSVQLVESEEHPSPASPLSESFSSTSIDRLAQLSEGSVAESQDYPNTQSPPGEELVELSMTGNKFRDMINLAHRWIENANSQTSILWFYGPSAMPMVSELIERQYHTGMRGHVHSTFTFSDKAAWNTEARQLFPAIAADLSNSIPGLTEQYRKVFKSKGFQELMTASLEIQFWILIIDPIRKLSSKPKVQTVIINAIDMCGYETARTILMLITTALVVFTLPLRFLISSNRDTRLQDLFNRPSLSSISRQFFVGTQPSHTYLPDRVKDPIDILRYGFQTICQRYPSLVQSGGKKWPSEDVFNILVERSRKNPIYADTVISFLVASVDGDPDASLQRVLKPTPPLKPSQEMIAGFADLDSLFTHILSAYPNQGALVHALGILLVLHDCAQPETIFEDIFGLRTGFYDAVLEALRSLMQFPKAENERDIHPWGVVKKNVPKKDQRVKSPFLVLALLSLSTMAMPTAFTIPLAFRDRVHDSFYDFLVNPERSGPFYVDIAEHHGHLTLAGFKCVVKYMWRPSRLDLQLSPDSSFSLAETWDYLTFHLPDHYSQCSDSVREEIIVHLQDALIAISKIPRDNAEPDIAVSTEAFLNNVAVLIDFMIKDWESFGQWSHFTSKRSDKHTDFRRIMGLIHGDLFPRHSQIRSSRLSGKFSRAPTLK